MSYAPGEMPADSAPRPFRAGPCRQKAMVPQQVRGRAAFGDAAVFKH